MRNVISLAHLSLDGFMAGPNADMSFLSMNQEMFDHIYPLIRSVDLAVYGRITHELMESYWPDQLDAESAHDREHARWYMAVDKLVASRRHPDIVEAVRAAKHAPGGDIMVFASPTLMHTLIAADLIDTYQLTIHPVLVGDGLKLFPKLDRQKLALADSRTFSNGVIGVRYTVKR